jgi:catechol 2,3-dioxygenase-like lactoylglutathione lyase family enzyme
MSDPSPVEFQSAIPNMLVADIPAATLFYTQKLGFTEAMTGANFAVITRGNITLAEYQRAGVTVLQPPQTWGEHTEFTIADLEGNRMDIGN